jgi:Kef-type K+ transport system membrane component KefB
MDIRVPLLVVLTAAVCAPLLAELTARWRVPIVVFELLLGALVGPRGLNWANSTGFLEYLSAFGLAFLFFLAGLEIDFTNIRTEMPLAVAGWLSALALGAFGALAMRSMGLTQSWIVVAIASSTTALGIVVPILRDGARLGSPLGRHVLAAGAMGEVGPILAMSLALSRRHSASVQSGFTLAFVVIVIAAAWTMWRARTPAVVGLMQRTVTLSSQLPVRVGVLLIASLAILADVFGLDLALGAMAAGMLIGLLTPRVDSHGLHLKMDAIGFGFLVPIFFVTSGMKLDLRALFTEKTGLLTMAAFLACVLVARVPLAVFHLRTLGTHGAAALGFLSATTLSLVVALTNIGVKKGLMTPAEAAPLVGAGILTVIVFPPLALKLAAGASRPGEDASTSAETRMQSQGLGPTPSV